MYAIRSYYALLITIVASFFSLNLAQSFSTGLILAISSTAIVLQTLSEKSLLKTRAGYYSFAVLLMQDMAVIPILAVLTLLTNQIVGLAGVDIQVATHVVVHSGWQKLLLIIVSVGSIVGIGRFVAFYVFRFIAESGIREVFTATALLLVVATTMAMNYVITSYSIHYTKLYELANTTPAKKAPNAGDNPT